MLFGALLCIIWVLCAGLFGDLLLLGCSGFMLFRAHYYLGALDFDYLELYFLSGCSEIRLI